MAKTWPEGWEDILSVIDRHDVYTGDDGTYGLETKPHVTVLYGLHDEVHEDLVCRVCQGVEGPLEVEVKGLSTFDKDGYDVLKFDVDSNLLRKMNKAFRSFPYTNDYEGEFDPHMTIAYLKKGTASKYMDKFDDKMPDKVRFPKMQFSPSGEEDPINFPLS